MRKTFLLILIAISVCSCDYEYQKQIGENYFIRCIESRERMNIGFGNKDGSEGLIDETVFEVYWNEQYIIALRHPPIKGSGGINHDVTEYYIIRKVILGEEKASSNTYGPLTREEYEIKIKELRLDTSKMQSVVFEDLK